MPPRLCIALVCCVAGAAGGAWAEDRVPSVPAPWPPADPAFGQPSLAQQYLAVPPGEASSGNRTEPAPSAECPHDRGPSDFLNQGGSLAEPGQEPQTPLPDTAAPAGEAAGPDARPVETVPLFSPDAWDSRGSGFAVAEFDEEPSQPPGLFPAPAVPIRPALPLPDVPEREVSEPSGAREPVRPAHHFTEDVPAPASDEAPADPKPRADREAPDDPDDPAAPAREPPPDAAMPLARPREAMPLQAPGATASEGSRRRVGGLPSAVTVVGGLAMVLGIFFLVAWGMRRAAPKALTTLPSQVVEVLGRAPLAGRQQVHLLRCGNKLLLVSVTPDAAETLTEITDPEEVDRLAGLCEQVRPHSSSAAFRRVLEQFAHEGEGAYER